MSREKPKKIKVSVGSRIFDTVNLISPLKFHHLPRGVVGCY